MSMKVSGMQELIDHFDKMNNLKAPKKALVEAGKHIKEVEQKTALEKHKKYSKNIGNKYIKAFPVRSYKKSLFIDIGLRSAGAGAEWDKIKGLYFNHYGFYHNGWNNEGTRENRIKNGRTGKYIAGSRWLDTAFERGKEKAYKIIEEELLKQVK